MFLQSIEGVVSMLAVFAVGWFLCGKSWFAQHGPDLFSKYAVRVAIPCFLFTTIYSQITSRSMLLTIFAAMPVPFVAQGITFLLAAGLARLLKLAPERRGVFINIFGLSNTIIAGFPVVEVLLGTGALADVMPYYVANTLWFWLFGVHLLRPKTAGPKAAPGGALAAVKGFFSPALVALLVGVVVVLSGLPVPAVILTPVDIIGRTAAGVSMLFIGCVIRQTNFKAFKFSRDILVVLAGRFVASPLVTYLLCRAVPIPAQMKLVFFIISMMPAMTQLGIMAKEKGSDYHYASVLTTLTTLLSLVAIPLYMLLAERLTLF